MKDSIHPTYNQKAKFTCSCGNTLEVGSTLPEIHVEICSNCHPFFTGKQKYIDTAGRIDRFKAKLEAREKLAPKPTAKKEVKVDDKEKAAPKDEVTETPVEETVEVPTNEVVGIPTDNVGKASDNK